MENPFDRLGLSPFATVDEITAALRERAEDASDEEKKILREMWEELTMHPRSRVRAAILTFPPRLARESRRPPRLSAELRPRPPSPSADPLGGVAAVDLLPRPSIASALVGAGKPPAPPPALPPLEDDPIIARAIQASSVVLSQKRSSS